MQIRIMFEGNPIDADLWPSAQQLGLIAFAMLVLTVWLRRAFPREWKLLIWSGIQPTRTWSRRLDEAPRTGGVWLSHAIGWLGWLVLGVVLESQWSFSAELFSGSPVQWDSAMRWGGIGAVVLLAHQCHRLFSRWLTLETAAVDRAMEWERHHRVWGAWVLAVGVVPVVYHPLLTSLYPLAVLAGVLLVFKWLRLLQLVFVMRLPLAWGIAYICTLEIAPTCFLWTTCFPD